MNSIFNKYTQLLSSLICGIFGVLAFSPYDFWPGSIISITRLLIIVLNIKGKQVIWNVLCWGIGFFGVGLHWIYIGIHQFINTYHCVSFILMILIIVYLTCFPILFSIFFVILRASFNKWSLISIAPILWSIIERLRGNTIIGFPWLQFGYSQIDGPMKGIAPILGVEGITFVLVFISGLLALSIVTMQLLPCILFLIILISTIPLSWIKWYYLDPNLITNVSLVQGNIKPNLHWNQSNINSTLQIYLKHTLPILGKTSIIIWPESAIPGNEITHNQFLKKLDHQLRKYQTCLITGIIDTKLIENNYYHYNSIIVLGNFKPYKYPNHNKYNKYRLVLCAENIPCLKYWNYLLHYLNIPIAFMSQGRYLQSQLQARNIKLTSAICYEIISGKQIRDNFKYNTNFLLTIANDIWFGNSIGPWQHFQISRMRALELGRPLLCSTNNGITAVIHADGSIHKQLPQFISGILKTNIASTIGITPYAKFGSYWLSGIIIFFCMYLIFFKKKLKIVHK